MPPTYQPPYDSPIEDEFALHYVKYAADSVLLSPQVKTQTICGLFIVDFVLSTPTGYRVGIECDGKEYHAPSRDEWRDAMILGEHHVDVIYRLRGSDITYHLEDVLYLLSELEPSLFSSRGIINLGCLATHEAREQTKGHDIDNYLIHYQDEDIAGSLNVEARRRIVPAGQRRFWQSAYRHAASLGGGQLDAVIADFRQERSSGI